jgi:parallel beta-helix repeat protein
VIENLSIAIDDSGSCISVRDTSVNFIIRNCMLSSSAQFPYTSLAKLQFFNVENGNVENCSVFGQIDIQYSRSCKIFNNSISPYHTDYVIYVYESQMVNISYNLISPSPNSQSEFGVFLRDSDNCVLSQNVVEHNGILHSTWTTVSPENKLAAIDSSGLRSLQLFEPEGGGIGIEGGSGCTVSENRIIGNIGDDVRAVNSLDLVLIRNEMDASDYGGVALMHSDRSLISANRIIGSLKIQNVMAATIVDNQFINGGLEFSSVEHLDDVVHVVSNNTIDGWPLLYLVNETSITVEPDETGQIILVNCSDTEIRNSIVKGFRAGSIEFYFCSHSALVNGRCSRISILNSNACSIEDFEIHGSNFGILTDNSPRTVIRNNIIHDTTIGIILSDSNSSIVRRNRIFEVKYQGIYLWFSDNMLIAKNAVSYCARSRYEGYYSERTLNSAIDLFYSNHSLVVNNTVLDNYGYGIRITSCSNVTVWYNILSGNADGNAYDSGTNNQWDDGVSKGNFWGDYIGVGMYYIPGPAGSVDRYPFDINGSAIHRILTQWVVLALVLVGIPIIAIYTVWRRANRASPPSGDPQDLQ